ncbi:uncharacterized protein [Linepithema humile]|uniref:uncharacterized protein isoform X3 n=1 Tax=Linepithema humile TaxID=83485 RepID=UPI00351F7BBB
MSLSTGKFSASIGELLLFITPKLRHPRHFAKETFVSEQRQEFTLNRLFDSSSTCPVCNVAIIHVDKKEENASESVVSFAPLPPKLRDERCRTCGETYENKCKHCKRKYCNVCWTKHVDDLKKEFNDISGNLETSAARFENKISNFQSKANEIKQFINRDIESKITELYKKRENQIKKVEHIVAISEASVEDIRRRMYKSQIEIRNQKDVSYDILPDNEKKVLYFELISF